MPPTSAILPSTSLVPIIEGLQGPWELQSILLYILFTVHLLLVNILFGTATFSLVDRLVFNSNKHNLSATHNFSVLLPKGIALVVNFGIPPLLFLQGIYGQFIYPSSIIMAVWWISIMALIIFAYYGLYLHATAKNLSEKAKTLALAMSVIIIAFIAFLLVNNITLMSSPEQWLIYAKNPHGTYLNFTQFGIIPRYLHFVVASIAIGGLTIAVFSRASLLRYEKVAENDKEVALDTVLFEKIATVKQRQKRGLQWFVITTLCQIPIGLWFLLSTPQNKQSLFLGESFPTTVLFVCALSFATFAVYSAIKQHVFISVMCITLTIFAMSFMRTVLRSNLLEPYYTPVMRKFESGPLTFFAVCTVGSIIVLAWMFKLYLQKNSTEMLGTGNSSIFLIDAFAEAHGNIDESSSLTEGLHSLYTENYEKNGTNTPQKRR